MKTIKERAKELLSPGAGEDTIFVAFELLKELVDAPEPEPVAWMVKNGFVCSMIYRNKKDADNYATDQQKRHDLSGSLASFCVIPLYTAPPAPSVPDGWRPFLTDVITAAGLLEHGKRDKGLASRIGKFAFDAMPAAQRQEPPANLVRDAERWLSQRDLELLVTFGMQADDCDADGHTLSKEQTRRLCELGVLRNVGFGRHEMTAFGDSIFGASHLRQGISLPLQTHAEHNAARERQRGE